MRRHVVFFAIALFLAACGKKPPVSPPVTTTEPPAPAAADTETPAPEDTAQPAAVADAAPAAAADTAPAAAADSAPAAAADTGAAAVPADAAAAETARAARYVACWGFFAAGDVEQLGGCYTDDATRTEADTGMGPFHGRDAIMGTVKTFRTAFPDAKGELRLVLVSGEDLAGVVLVHGTQTGPLASPSGEVPASGKGIGLLELHAVHLHDQQADQEWWYFDQGSFLSQLGLSPAPARAAVAPTGEAPKVVAATGSEAEAKNMDIAKASFAAVNAHDADALAKTMAAGATVAFEFMPADLVGADAIRKGMAAQFTAFPDLKVEIERIFAAGDYVVAFATASGTNSGEFPPMGLHGTGKTFSHHIATVMRIADGAIAEEWLFGNGLAVAMQLGAVPPPPAPPEPK